MIQSLIVFNSYEILHKTHKKRKHLLLSIDEYGEITLKTPTQFSKKKIYSFLEEKESWIQHALAKLNTTPKPKPLEEIELFGLIFFVSEFPDLAKKLALAPKKHNHYYNEFYKEVSKQIILPRVEYFAKKMALKPKCVRFRSMKRRWGSCSSDNVLTFNTKLVKKELDFIEEVIVHELSHMVHFNHSKAFYLFVKENLATL